MQTHAHSHTHTYTNTHTHAHRYIPVCTHLHTHTHTLKMHTKSNLSAILYMLWSDVSRHLRLTVFEFPCVFDCSALMVRARRHPELEQPCAADERNIKWMLNSVSTWCDHIVMPTLSCCHANTITLWCQHCHIVMSALPCCDANTVVFFVTPALSYCNASIIMLCCQHDGVVMPHKRFKGTLFVRTKHMQTFGSNLNPLYQATYKMTHSS